MPFLAHLDSSLTFIYLWILILLWPVCDTLSVCLFYVSWITFENNQWRRREITTHFLHLNSVSLFFGVTRFTIIATVCSASCLFCESAFNFKMLLLLLLWPYQVVSYKNRQQQQHVNVSKLINNNYWFDRETFLLYVVYKKDF